jgi:pimeloyl-ACP methyl ester carboxylesterase
VLARWFSADIEDREPEHYAYARKRFLTTSPVGYAGCCAALGSSDLQDRVNAIDAPTLIVAGSEDVPTPPVEARRLHESIGRSQLEIIAGAAHISNLDAEEQFTRSLRRFLKGHAR